ncbi:alkene reductase [Pricia sp.]|uniref:alkene reductase n=1 Tax=Pricia sp. TaxID=2268138 RepID=UPI0035936E9F
MKEQSLLTPYDMNGLKLPNRIIMAPMTRSRAENDNNAPTKDLHVPYYTQRATAGLIISEGSQVSNRGVGYINTAGMHNEAQIAGWKKVTESVHKADGRIFAQLWHVGRISHPDFHDGELPWAPSALNPDTEVFTPEGQKKTVKPKAMSLSDIKITQNEFVQAAKNAIEAGFDGVEIHASNGYLFHQFFNGTSNHRDDNYGGTKENKARFFFEVLDAVKKVVPENRVGVRFNPSLHGIFGMTMDEDTIPTFDYIIERLDKEYDLAYIHLSEPFNDVSDLDYAESNIAERYRPKYKGTIMINAGFDQEKGNKVIDEGNADLVSFAKLYVSNPDLVGRFRDNIPVSDWNEDTFYTPGKKGYTNYEAKTRELIPNK